MKKHWATFRFWLATKRPKNYFIDEGLIIEITRGKYKRVRFTFDDIKLVDDSIKCDVSILYNPRNVNTETRRFISVVSDIMRVLVAETVRKKICA